MILAVTEINFMYISKSLFYMFCDQKEAEQDLKLLSEVSIAAVWINKTGHGSSPVAREHPTMAQFNSPPEQGGQKSLLGKILDPHQ